MKDADYGKGQCKVAKNKLDVIDYLSIVCTDESAAVEFWERHRWGDNPCCVQCGSTTVYQMKDSKTGGRSKRFLWRCRDCKRQYTVRIGVVLEDSRIPLRHWCYALWQACTSMNGVTALEIRRQTGLSYKSALFLMHRIRFALVQQTAHQSSLQRCNAIMATDKPEDALKPGPDAEYLKLGLDLEAAVHQMVKKKRPPEGWPDHPESERIAK